MRTIEDNLLEQEEYLKPAKLGKRRLAQIHEILEQNGDVRPFSDRVVLLGLKYVALDWRFENSEPVEPMLSFFIRLPKRSYSGSEGLSPDFFATWLPLPTKWLDSWNKDKAYRLPPILFLEEEAGK